MHPDAEGRFVSQAKALRFARSALNRLTNGAGVKADGLVGGAAAQVAAARTMQRTRGLSVVSRIKGDFGNGQGTAAAADVIVNTIRIRHQNITGKALLSVAPLYAHWAPAGSTEAATPLPLLIKSALDVGGTVTDQTKRMLANKSGRSTFVLDRRMVAAVDEFGTYIVPNAYFYEVTGVGTVGSAGSYARHQIALGGTANWGKDTGEGGVTTDFPANLGNNTVGTYSAVGMLGRTVDGTIAQSVCISGDSTSVGSHDGVYGPNAGGWPWRACQQWPGMSIGIAGEKLEHVVNPLTFSTRFDIARYHTHVLDGYLINDVGQGRTVSQMKADLLTQAYKFMSWGIHYMKATCLPLTDSTDGHLTVASQTKRANEARRTGVNDYLRDTSGNGFVAQADAAVANIPGAGRAFVIDVCSGYEVDASNTPVLNGGFIKAPVATLYTGTATAGSTSSLTDSSKNFPVNGLAGKVIRITTGAGAGQVGVVSYNTATVVTLPIASFFPVTPDTTSTYVIYDGLSVDGTHPSGVGSSGIADTARPAIAAVLAETAL